MPRSILEGNIKQSFYPICHLLTKSSGFSTYWPYTRQIPGTEMTFKLNYQSLIGRDKVDAVMSTSEFIIMQKIEYLGEATQLQVDHEGRQTWRNEVDGVRLAVTNLPSRMLVWGNVRDLVKGVGLYCAAQACMFEFSVGDSEVSIGNGSLSQAY